MKIDRCRLKKCTSEVPTECQALISKLRSCSHAELLEELKQIDAWTFGKCELFHWIDVLDLSDSILEEAAARSTDNQWELACDLPQNREAKELLLWVLHFTTLLIEHSFSRHLYNSMEHLVTLLSSCDMHVVLGVLNLLYMFSKRSNFITRLNSDKRQALLSRLNHLAESWGGKENGFGLADCCKEQPDKPFPTSATTLHFEFYAENPIVSATTTATTTSTTTSTTELSTTNSGNQSAGSTAKKNTGQTNLVTYIHIEGVDKMRKTPAQIMNDLLKSYNVPQERQMALLTHIRLAHSFSDYRRRLQCVQARLQALSVLVYSNALQENAHSLLHTGLLEELVELLELPHPHLVEIRAAALRTLTSIIHLDRNPHFPKKPGSRLNMIIDVTGASSYHGFLPVLVRTCISTLTSPQPDGQPFPLPLATALFSFLYHLASYEAGGEALVSCGMMESLLKVINWPGSELEHITFVTRAVRVIDLITNIDMQGFQAHGGLVSFINRLDMEVNVCRKEQPFEIEPQQQQINQEVAQQQNQSPSQPQQLNTERSSTDVVEDDSTNNPSSNQINNENFDERGEESSNPMEFSEDENTISKIDIDKREPLPDYSGAKTGKTCLPQRAALLKSMLNFLKKAIQDPAFTDSIRHVMEGTLPASLKHIISNSEYYGPSLFLLATDVVTVYVFQEPSLLSSLQDNGLTDVVLHALLIKDVPATREVLGSLPNVFSALCLNQRGLESFVKCRPFERLFKVLLSPVYLSAMRRRRSADPLGDTASNLGNAMDELMRHQPSLKVDATAAIIKLLEELCVLGCDPRYVCWRAASKSENSPSSSNSSNRQSSGQSVGVGVGDGGGGGGGGGGSSSDEEDEDEEEASTSSHPQREEQPSPSPAQPGPPPQPREKTPIALVDYIHNVMKFVDAILSNNSTDDHCREFVAQKGLVPLLSILGLPNLPVDYPVAQAAQAVASVCKSILNLAHEPSVLETGLKQLSEVLNLLKPLHCHMESPGGSVLLHELASASNLETAFTSDQATPLLHAMNAAHGYVVMFVHVCRTGQSEIRNLSMNHWGSDRGLLVLKGLSELYTSLVWESTLLLALCSDDIIPAGCDFGKEDMDKLVPPELRTEGEASSSSWAATTSSDMGSNGMTTAMEALSTDPPPVSMEVDDKPISVTGRTSPSTHQLKYIKPLLGASSRLGRALAELFGLLVKLCVGSPIRQRRGQQLPMTPSLPTQAARSVAKALNGLLTRGLSWDKLPPSPIPKFRLTFLICSVGFTSPMLFDEKRHPYHLMLQTFVHSGGQTAFFATFHWALSGGGQFPLSEGLEHPDLPDGTGEFLDAWLMLLEKMVNPKAILDSPHAVSSKSIAVYRVYETFDPIKYLTDIHKKAFESVMLMWGKKPLKNYGARMTESILSILRHILRGEKIIKERAEKEESTESTSTTAGTTGASSSVNSVTASTTERREEPEADVNPQHLRQLMDMGFSRTHCIEALLHTLNVEQATDYLLTNPATLRRPDAPAGDASGQGLIMDLELVDHDQIMHAIAMSLGDTDPRKFVGGVASTEEPVKESPPTKSIDDFTHSALEQCLNLLDLMPDTVYRICDLLVTITKRNGDEWRDSTLRQLIREIGDLVDFLIDIAENGGENNGNRLIECEEASKVAGRIYLYTLFFEGPFQEMRVPCAQIVEECGITEKLVRLLVVSEGPLTESKTNSKNAKENNKDTVVTLKTPKWLAPLLLLIDRLEKVAVLTQRKQLMHKVTNRIWKWFDLSTGKWTPYSAINNRAINDAYWAGESSVRITCGRRRYLITFSCMTQVNEDSDNRRPITMEFKLKNTNSEDGGNSTTETNMDTEECASPAASKSPEEDKRNTVVQGLDPSVAPNIVRACVKLLAIPVDRDALHALMKVCLRLTRDYKNAEVFAREGGVKLLLDMTQGSSFIGCISLSTLLIRHTLEEPRTLCLAMEKVVRARTLTNIPPAYKEILYMTRQISSAVCRNPEVYREVCENILRVDINVLKRDDVDNRLLVKALPPTHSPAMPMVEEVSVGVIQDLLNALIKPMPVLPDDGTTTPAGSPEKKTPHPTTSVTTTTLSTTSRRDLLRSNTTTAAAATAAAAAAASTSDPLDDDDQVSQIIPLKMYADIGNNGKVEPEEAKKPLLPKSAILKMLAEAVRSYGAVANLITEHTYRAGQSELVIEDTTALAFLLDKLLPMLPENTGDRQCSSMARMLIAALASCNHSPDAQTTLVTEVKAALTRSLALPESSEKHAQLQLLIGLISTMIDNCPPTAHTHLRASLKLHQYSNVNNIVRIMLKKGIVTDLAKIPHSLDLSSPNMAGTINAALKPLETLSRIINQPMPGAVSNKFAKPKNSRNAQEEPTGEQTGTTNSEATHAVGEETNEDAENTEHDISVTAESLEPTSESHVHEEGDEAALDDIMDQLLERDGSAITEEPPSRPHRPMDIDEESLAMREAEGEFDPARDTTEDLMSSDSDSDSNASDDNEDEVQDDDDDEEEEEDDAEENEEEEEEEEEGSSNYEEDGMEFYEDVGEGVFRMLPSADRDSGNVVMIQHNIENQDNGSSTPASTGPSLPWNTNFPLPFGIFDDPTAIESNGINSHPLLMARNNLDAASLPASRAQHTLRQRRYQYLQLTNPRNTNPPVILQRLLGPTAQTLPLATSQVLASSFRDTRVVVMDNGLGIFTNQEEEQIDFVDQSGYLFGPSLAATLNNIPTALHWWIEESKLLDGDSQPDCCVGVVQKLIPGLEKYRNTELAERKEKRKKQHAAGDKEPEKEEKTEKDQASDNKSGSASTAVPTEEQRTSASTTSTLREDTRQLVAAVEAAVEAARQERNPDEDIIEVTGEMEVTVQEDEDRTPSPPPEEQQRSEVRDPRIATRNATLELAESIVDSVLRPSASEATRLQRQNVRNPEDLSPINLRNRAAPILVDFNQEVYQDLPTDIESSSNPTDWIRRLLTDDTQLNVERNANVVSQGPSSSTAENSAQESQNPQQPQQQDPQLPDGVDPSFLAALPEDMREEVIAEQLRLQRIRQRAQATVVEEPTGPVEVNPEFLAALPPAIQEEVLAQQRLEQQRHAAASANPEDPVDAAAFFQNLQPSLRQAILTDMEESQISVLPPDLAQEAQSLRRDWEARNRQMMQERFLSHVSQSSTALSSILRNSGRGRGGGARYAIHTVPQRAQWSSWNPRGEAGITHQGAGLRLRGRQLLDHESMACLLVLLFVDEPKINTLRLHRVIRNLCYHGSTREWVVRALLSIMERSNDESKDSAADFGGRFKRKGLYPMIDFGSPKVAETRNSAQSWLNISMDAALGCRANVFHITRHGGKRSERQCNIIAIHPQAAPTVCRHTLELLISLAKSFPGYFVPLKSKESEERENREKEIKDSKEKEKETNNGSKEDTGAKTKSASKPGKSDLPDFWDMLLRLDSCASKKGKSVARTHSYSNLGSEPEQSVTSFEISAFGQLISMLNWSVIKRSSQLTDKLLRLLSLISIGLTEVNPYRRQEGAKNKKVDIGKEQSVAAPEGHLRLAVQVLTSKSCSEEGLEDATALLLNLSHSPDPTRQLILKLLLEGAMELANMVCEHINDLMMELKVLNREINRRYSVEEQPSTSSGGSGRGILHDRFTNDNVVVTAPSKVKAGSDLQLPSMGALVSKTSSQAFFLRILKVIVQIREAVRLAHKKKTEVNQTAETAMDTGTTSQQAPVAVAEENVEAVAMDTTQANASTLDTSKTSAGSADTSTSTSAVREEEEKSILPLLSESLVLDNLWETLSACLLELEHTPDHHAVLVLQPAVEAFFLVHSSSSTPTRERSNDTTTESRDVVPDLAPVSPIYSDNEGASQPEAVTNSSWDVVPTPQITLPSDQLKFLKFAETHRTVLNQILRQTTTHLADGPFSVLVDHTRVLDFDVKRRYFRTELERMDEGIRREELAVHVRRSHIFEDSFRELHRRNADEWKNRFYIVFEGEEGQDAGGLLREWYVIISREIFNPMYALFTVSPGDRVTYMINSSSHCNPNHLCYYKFVGRVIAKAIYDNKLLECYFTRSFYKHILGILVKHTDMESEDYSFYKGLVYLTEHNVSDLGYELTFSAEVNEFGVNDVRDLIPNGRNIVVTEETKLEYIRLVCQMKMTGAIRKQLNAFLEGFYDIIPKRLISIFNEQELELLISGLPNVDIEDLKANTEYHKYSPTSLQIQWFWRALRGFDQADRAKFLQFVTGTSKVPLQGFGALEGMNGVQKFQIHRDDRSTDRLPSAHTCFNQLDLPVYETYDKLRSNLLKAIHECSEGFGFA